MSAPAEQVLIIDDDDEFRALLSIDLEKLGFAVHGVENAYQAKMWLESGAPTLIFLDLMMPDGNGLDFCRWLRSKAKLKSIPVLVVTGIKDEEYAHNSLDLGAMDVMTKPHSMHVLREKVQRLLARSKLPKEEQ